MKNRVFRQCWKLAAVGALAFAASATRADDIQFRSQTFFGGTDLEQGTGISVVNSGSVSSIYLSGVFPSTISPLNYEGIALKYTLNAGSFTPQFQWNRGYPGVAGEDQFSSVTANASSVFFAGHSFSRTTDTVGSKEIKGIIVNLPTNGVGTTWEKQTPTAPGAFTYGGTERLLGVTQGVANSQPVLYAVGGAQSGFFSPSRLFISQVDLAGNLLWTKTDSVGNPVSSGNAVTAVGSSVFVAGSSADSGQSRGFVRRYDDQGNLNWSFTSSTGQFNAMTYDAGTNSLFMVGQTNGGSPDFLVEKWDTNGNVIWSRTFDRNSGSDVLNGIAISNGVFVAVGTTTGNTAGGQDGIVMQFDPLNGNLINSTLWGGALDDSFSGVSFQGDLLHVVGTTNSFGAGGSDAAYVLYQVAAVPEPSTILLTSSTAIGIGVYLCRRKRQQVRLAREWV